MSTSSTTSTVLRYAVCLFHNVCALDYQGPVELHGFLSPESSIKLPLAPKFQLEIIYLAPEKDMRNGGVKPVRGPRVIPDKTYEEVIAAKENFDILLVPGGQGTRPRVVPEILLTFIQNHISNIRGNQNGYVLSVCTGSWILATAGMLDGKYATTNKAAFKECKAETSDVIKWVPKARWVEEDNKQLWTSSGVTAGDSSMDMAAAFLEHLVGNEITTYVRGIIELSVRTKDDDEFAEYHGLVDVDQSQ